MSSSVVAPECTEELVEYEEREYQEGIRTNTELKRVVTTAAKELGKLKVAANTEHARVTGPPKARAKIHADPRNIAKEFALGGERRRSRQVESQPLPTTGLLSPSEPDSVLEELGAKEATDGGITPMDAAAHGTEETPNSTAPDDPVEKHGPANVRRQHRLSFQRSLPPTSPETSPTLPEARVPPGLRKANAGAAETGGPKLLRDLSAAKLGPPRDAFPTPK
jgi:hypothetical protein